MHNNLLIDNFVLLPATPKSPMNIEKLNKGRAIRLPDPGLAHLIQGLLMALI